MIGHFPKLGDFPNLTLLLHRSNPVNLNDSWGFSKTPSGRENARRGPIFPGGGFENTSRTKIAPERGSFVGWQVFGKSFMNHSG